MAETGRITIDKRNRRTSYAKERNQTYTISVVVGIVFFAVLAGKEPDEYLYHIDELGCYIRNVIAADGQYLKETEETASETVVREYFITSDIKWFEDRKEWKKLKTIGYEKKTITRKRTGDTIIEERYFLCSIEPVAELFAIVVRRHWHIENGLHWALDIVFREDRLRAKEKNGIHNLELIQRFVLFIIKLMKTYYHRSMKRIRSKIGRNLKTELPVILGKQLRENAVLFSKQYSKNSSSLTYNCSHIPHYNMYTKN